MLTAVMKKGEAVSSRETSAFWKKLIAIGGIILGILLLLSALISRGFSF